MPTVDIERLRSIKTFPSLVKYLRDELDWPIDTDAVEDLTFEYQPEELGLDAKHAAKIKEIKQLRPLDSKQPWGIFWVNFEKKHLPMVVLRRILGSLVVKKRASANKIDRPNWQLNDLLFISSYGEEEHRTISFAHFTEDPSTDELPVLRILGWDDQNSIMHLDRVAGRLETHFRWPGNPAELETWRRRWTEGFTDRYREAIRSADVLIPKLAQLARAIRKRVRDTLDAENERGPMRKLLAAVRGLLIHDMDEDAFADMYAQTVAYGLLSARFSRPAGLTAQNLVQLTSVSNPFLENLLENLFRLNRGKFHFDVDEVGINDVLDLLRKTNIDAIKAAFNDQNPAEDPVIRFYEGFLKEYDPKQRIRRGIFFTPRPVVSYIVRSVHELLQAEFGLEEGLASTVTWGEMIKKFHNMKLPESVKPGDPFVCILDPATGTGTFLFTCIEVIERTMKDKWCRELGKKGWNDPEILARWREYVARHLLPRLYGYELMMAPYAIAHLKLALKLGETGYQFREADRLHIYLTNSLEPPSELADRKLADLFATLAKEAQEVNEIKRHKRFTVVIGNPPYSVTSANFNSFIDTLMNDYKKHVRGEQGLVALVDDYLKFIRISQELLRAAGCGVWGMITNHGYLKGVIHRGVRKELLGQFSSLFILDLHGDSNIGERVPAGKSNENVFDIKQGVSVSIGVQFLPSRPETAARHSELWGIRTEKYDDLALHPISARKWAELRPTEPSYFLIPFDDTNLAEYKAFPSIDELMPVNSCGVKTHRDGVVIDFDKKVLISRMTDVASERRLELLRERYGVKDTPYWKLKDAQAKMKAAEVPSFVHGITYRPFDWRWIYYNPTIIEKGDSKYPTLRHMLQSNLALLTARIQATGVFDAVFVSKVLVEMKTAESSRSCTAFPLFLSADRDSPQAELTANNRRPNFNPKVLSYFAQRLGVKPRGDFSLPEGFTPEDIFHYTYAVLHSPGYRSRYVEFLKIDFPRLPLTSSLELFRALARLGGKLVALHLLESPKLENLITRFVDNAQNEIEKVSYARETVWLDKAQTTGFAGVPEAVWNFHIGGYQVCEKWLKDRRGRKLSKEDITHYHRIVVALKETIRLMPEIDEVINKHGGWPGAFASTSYNEPPESEMPLAAEASASYGKGEPEK